MLVTPYVNKVDIRVKIRRYIKITNYIMKYTLYTLNVYIVITIEYTRLIGCSSQYLGFIQMVKIVKYQNLDGQ